MKIAVGTGAISRNGFKVNDIRNLPNVDFVCPAWDLDQYVPEKTVEIFYSNHFFEHLTFEQCEKVLEVWYKLLCPGGKVEMQLPNIDVFVQYWIDGVNENNLELFEFATKGFWGWQREGLTEMWDVHKSGYNAKSLQRLVNKNGYVNFKNLKTKVGNLKVEFYKEEENQ
jgi:predicted SAM-dependent methyltransferase